MTSNGDMAFVNGECPVTSSLLDSVIQRTKIKLGTFYGEWFLNTTYGIPYFQVILQKTTPKAVVDSIFKTQILQDKDILSIVEFNSILDNQTRKYSMTFRIKVRDGSVSPTQQVGVGV